MIASQEPLLVDTARLREHTVSVIRAWVCLCQPAGVGKQIYVHPQLTEAQFVAILDRINLIFGQRMSIDKSTVRTARICYHKLIVNTRQGGVDTGYALVKGSVSVEVYMILGVTLTPQRQAWLNDCPDWLAFPLDK